MAATIVVKNEVESTSLDPVVDDGVYIDRLDNHVALDLRDYIARLDAIAIGHTAWLDGHVSKIRFNGLNIGIDYRYYTGDTPQLPLPE